MSETIRPGALYVVSTPIGNLGDISYRAAQILGGVDLVAAEDTRTTGILLNHLSLKKPLVSYFSRNEKRRVPALLQKLAEGQSIAIVTDAGTPGISDPAYVIIKHAIAAGYPVIPVPGPSALLAALVVSGLPTDRFVFEGFLPLKKGRKTCLDQISRENRTVVIYESPYRVMKTLEELGAACGDRDVAVVREITKKFEQVIRGKITEVVLEMRRATPRGEYVIVLAGLGYISGGVGQDQY